MKSTMLCLAFLSVAILCRSQAVYTIRADSVKITNNCDSAELILQNHTQGVPGFLYNLGNGRTAFKHALQKLNDSTYLIGADTLRVFSAASALGVVVATGNYTATTQYSVTTIVLNASSGTITLPDPTLSTSWGKEYYVRTSTTGQTATLATASGSIEVTLGVLGPTATISGMPFNGWVSDHSNWRISK